MDNGVYTVDLTLPACIEGAVPLGSFDALWKGFAKGRYVEELGTKAAARVGLAEVPLAGLLAGCLTGEIGHYAHGVFR